METRENTVIDMHLTVRYTTWSEKYGNWKQLEIKIALNAPAECEIHKLCCEYVCIPHRVNFLFCEESVRPTPATLFSNAALRAKSLLTSEQGKSMRIKRYGDVNAIAISLVYGMALC